MATLIKNNHLMELMLQPGTVICRLPGNQNRRSIFSAPSQVLKAQSLDDIPLALEQLERFTKRGFYGAGFIAYEAAQAFDRAFQVKKLTNFPYLWVGIYPQAPEPFLFQNKLHAWCQELCSEITRTEYIAIISAIKKELERGNIYQANFTFRCRSKAILAPERLFLALCANHPTPYSAFINTGNHKIISLSPELFLEKNAQQIISRPMKGTVGRKENPEDDRRQIEFLSNDPKNLAENLMIVDMMRNDFGKICIPGSIRAEPLFNVDTYATLHQMTSDVRGELPKTLSLYQMLQALFPASSITGAPKVAAMRVIEQYEKSPRKIYTGTIGCFMPGGDCCLNVAIRTLICADNETELGIGGGIVNDSQPEDEWNEAILKSRFAQSAIPEFNILETMLWENQHGIKYLDEHLKRAEKSQRFFERTWNRSAIDEALTRAENYATLQKWQNARFRLLIAHDGTPAIETRPFNHSNAWSLSPGVKVSNEATASNDLFLQHKADYREFYNRHFQQARHEGFDEIIFFNERGELTEGAISNIFIKLNDQWHTPHLSCGLLPGIWRKKMILKLGARESIITEKKLHQAQKIIIGNSVRGTAEVRIKT